MRASHCLKMNTGSSAPTVLNYWQSREMPVDREISRGGACERCLFSRLNLEAYLRGLPRVDRIAVHL